MSFSLKRVGCITFVSSIFCLTACSDNSGEMANSNSNGTLASTSSGTSTVNEARAISALQARVDNLRVEAERIRSSNDIKRLQRAFGFYFDEGLWDEMVDLFSDDASIEYARDGVYMGKERIREYLYALGNGKQGLPEGELNEHMQLMPIISLSEDGQSAKGRWRDIILKGQFSEWAWWGEGPFENEYVKEDGVWKISKLHWFQTIMVPYEGGWAQNADVNDGIYVSDTIPPDAPMSIEYDPWPETFLPPFHFPNPVEKFVPSPEFAAQLEEAAQ